MRQNDFDLGVADGLDRRLRQWRNLPDPDAYALGWNAGTAEADRLDAVEASRPRVFGAVVPLPVLDALNLQAA